MLPLKSSKEVCWRSELVTLELYLSWSQHLPQLVRDSNWISYHSPKSPNLSNPSTSFSPSTHVATLILLLSSGPHSLKSTHQFDLSWLMPIIALSSHIVIPKDLRSILTPQTTRLATMNSQILRVKTPYMEKSWPSWSKLLVIFGRSLRSI